MFQQEQMFESKRSRPWHKPSELRTRDPTHSAPTYLNNYLNMFQKEKLACWRVLINLYRNKRFEHILNLQTHWFFLGKSAPSPSPFPKQKDPRIWVFLGSQYNSAIVAQQSFACSNFQLVPVIVEVHLCSRVRLFSDSLDTSGWWSGEKNPPTSWL